MAVYEFKFTQDQKTVQRVNDTWAGRWHNRQNANCARVTLKQDNKDDMSLYFERGYYRPDEDGDLQKYHYGKILYRNRADVTIYVSEDGIKKMFAGIGTEDPIELKNFGYGIYKFAQIQDLLTTADYSFINELVNVWSSYVQSKPAIDQAKIFKIILHMTTGILKALNEEEGNMEIKQKCKAIIAKINPQKS